jgi:small subunit ribosomal protein S9
MSKIILSSGKRKKAVARASIREGKGTVKVNKCPLSLIKSQFVKLKIQEPLFLASDVVSKLDIDVDVRGGGQISQAEAVRLAIAKGLAEYNPKLKKVFLDYDRMLLVADVRQRESRKPNSAGKARSKVQKSYR